MCGICGFNWTDERLLERMKATLTHRGPDGHGSYVADGISLGHLRLSIVDLSEAGKQPLTNEDGTIWVTFNGEIYNYPTLRRLLEQRGHRFRGHSDTESIVHAYEEFGLDVVQHLTGMFAFAIWDSPRRRMLLARDRLGIKPLYYTLDRGKRRFASEIKALLADPTRPRALNGQSLFDLIGYEFTPAPPTPFQGVQKLLPGCMLVLEGDGSSRVVRILAPRAARRRRYSRGTYRSARAGVHGSHDERRAGRILYCPVPGTICATRCTLRTFSAASSCRRPPARKRPAASSTLRGPCWMTVEEKVSTFARALDVRPPTARLPCWLGLGAGWAAELAGAALRVNPPISRRTLAFFENDNAFDISAARRALQYEPRTELLDDVRRTLREHRDGARRAR
jgi:hypothetical protein